GRGRLGRAFASPDGTSLALTFAHRTSLGPARRGWFPLAAGLAVVAALERAVPAAAAEQRIGLKWPNDLHTADGRKLGGILVEARGDEDLLLGIGLNLRGPVLDEDGEPVPGAAWLRGEAGLRPDAGPAEDRGLREALEESLVAALGEELAALESAQGDGDAAGTRDRYTMTCLTLGRTVRVDPLGEAAAGANVDPALRGTVLDVDEHGRLVLDRADGEGRIAVDVGDVRHLRPAAS
ncbi:MAG: biotin--[acetyl-CoA-carboxylase] ligase, partial [Brachybacterium paraconglomeratum]|nr:biotin--[acetyl-CoA-carboxylase] ligase [Brachybacterium paraconglomeratum]